MQPRTLAARLVGRTSEPSRNMKRLAGHIVFAAVSLAMAASVHAVPFYFVGIDAMRTYTDTGQGSYPISPDYFGLQNPNYNRLTFIVADVPTVERAHFHSVGAYTYTGPTSSPTTQDTFFLNNTDLQLNRAPEPIFPVPVPPVSLVPGTGANAGRLVSPQVDGVKYEDLRMQSVQNLATFPTGSVEHFLFNGNVFTDPTTGIAQPRWNGPLPGAQVGLQLLSISNGLNIADHTGASILQNPGDIHPLGPGNSFFFSPTFWTEGTAAVGTYSAEFRFIDQAGVFDPSGRFFLDVQVVPVPAAVWLFGSGLAAMAGFARRQRGTGSRFECLSRS